ncbi:UNKNOWN [Stylonychia lemnae]|uniref:Transmembrane protein n=1 Tax=Stylonychia lemnae TaxID=5949 RepID=A0A077ZVZ0_STYLE|nr:UNKNOWN [Stylonychia lemnae]|eukprot:CDW72606.1 UNKNOWN [Stylonychia lemnae]
MENRRNSKRLFNLFQSTKSEGILKALSKTNRDFWLQRAVKNWKNQDVYGRKVEFTYKGSRRYKTLLGATFTFGQRVAISIFIIYQFYMLALRLHPNTHIKQKVSTLDGVDNGIPDQTYGSIHAQSIVQLTDQPNSYNPYYENIYDFEIEKCSRKHFAYVSNYEWNRYRIGEFYCIKSESEIIIEGDKRSNRYQHLNIQLQSCQNTTNISICKSESQIKGYFQNKTLQYVYINTNFDFMSYDQEIQYFLDDVYEINIDADRHKNIQMKIQNTSTQQYDNFFTFWDYVKYYYYQVGETTKTDYLMPINLGQKVFASIQVVLDKRTMKYVRQVENLFDVLESIGGFKESIFSIILILIIFFQERLFKASFIKQLYQEKGEKQSKKKSNSTQLDLGSGNSRKYVHAKTKQDHLKKRELFQQKLASMHTITLNKQRVSDLNVIEILANKNFLQDNIITKIINEILRRKAFRYGYQMAIHYILKCVCLRSKDSIKKNKAFKQHLKYERGNEKLERELDVVNLLKSIRQLKALLSTILPIRSRLLLKFSKKNLLQSSSSSSESDFHNHDLMRDLNSKNNFKKLAAVVKLKKALSHYKANQMDQNEKVLIKGIFIRKAKDFHDEFQNNNHILNDHGGLSGSNANKSFSSSSQRIDDDDEDMRISISPDVENQNYTPNLKFKELNKSLTKDSSKELNAKEIHLFPNDKKRNSENLKTTRSHFLAPRVGITKESELNIDKFSINQYNAKGSQSPGIDNSRMLLMRHDESTISGMIQQELRHMEEQNHIDELMGTNQTLL